MKIDVRNPERFRELLTKLASELHQGFDHFMLFQDLRKVRKKFLQEFAQSGTFWYLTNRRIPMRQSAD